MGRKRKNPADNWMPPRVRRGRSAYEFQTYDSRTVRLCDFSATQAEVWLAYEKLLAAQKNDETLNGLVKAFFLSPDFLALARETQKDYQKYAGKLLAVFGNMLPDTIKPEHIRKYMDKRGLRSKTQANREKNFLSRVFGWGYERGIVKGNPCKGVRQFKEIPRGRYITDAEYNALYSVASPMVKVAMELAYLCCARQADILELTYAQIKEDGIFIKQGKTNVAQIKAWTKRLENVIALSRTLPLDNSVSSIYVLHQRGGSRYSRDGFNSRWKKAKAEATRQFPELDFHFTFHDLKAKGVSDLEGSLAEKQFITGHKNITQTARYDRKVKIVPVVGGQKK
ncbi:tyrosine-type recombinase/integrase [Xenorhabdus szentirmaii]|uniref:Integrase n=1 Tax=Xenorhabdus szentirmaii DSM 16338 TaxID=1427518 RepID=W1J687_9GAMM|nr:tyrosine-type recombinase/integrase [Xenorhabdus szentirmaii]PHM31964.1 integrase [Xenorhabdus szentirmaii DSM 16338]CDL85371.1 putative integrase [Xenorhabdus szentirmaii DSM 16338]